MVTRLIDFLKIQGVTALMTNLTSGPRVLETSGVDISSLVDTWILLRDLETDGERNRALYILKSRGMSHSNQIREFLLTDQGIDLQDVYLGPEGVLTGSARQSQEARERAAAFSRRQELDFRRRERERKREALEVGIAAMRRNFEAEEEEAQRLMRDEQMREDHQQQERDRMAAKRKADARKEGTIPAKPGDKTK
jgi:circadian clock protein KaiC